MKAVISILGPCFAGLLYRMPEFLQETNSISLFRTTLFGESAHRDHQLLSEALTLLRTKARV